MAASTPPSAAEIPNQSAVVCLAREFDPETLRRIAEIFQISVTDSPLTQEACFQAVVAACINEQWGLIEQAKELVTGLRDPFGLSVYDACVQAGHQDKAEEITTRSLNTILSMPEKIPLALPENVNIRVSNQAEARQLLLEILLTSIASSSLPTQDATAAPRLGLDDIDRLVDGLDYNDGVSELSRTADLLINLEERLGEGNCSTTTLEINLWLQYVGRLLNEADFRGDLERLTKLYYSAGKMFSAVDSPHFAQDFFYRALEVGKTCRGDHLQPLLIDIYARIGVEHCGLKEYQQALTHFQHAIDRREAFVQGQPDSGLVVFYRNMGELYAALEEPQRVLEWLRKAIEMQERVSDDKRDKELAELYWVISRVYISLEDRENTLTALRAGCALLEALPGGEHQEDIAAFYYALGECYLSNEEWHQAEEWCRKALVIHQALFENNPDSRLAESYDALAFICFRQGNMEEALQKVYSSCTVREALYPRRDDPNLAHSYIFVASIYVQSENGTEALEWYLKGIGVLETCFIGQNRSDVADHYMEVAGLQFKLEQPQEALRWLRKAAAMQEALCDENEQMSLLSLYDKITTVHESVGEYDAAIHWYNKALSILVAELVKEIGAERTAILSDRRGETFVEWHRRFLGGLYGLFNEQRRTGNLLSQLIPEPYRRVPVNLREAIARTYCYIGLAYFELQRYEQALQAHQLALVDRRALYEPDVINNAAIHREDGTGETHHPDLAFSHESIGDIYLAQGKLQQALACYEKALAVRRPYFRDGNHELIARSYNKIAGVHAAARRYRRAVEKYEQARRMFVALDEEEHRSDIVECDGNIGDMNTARGDHQAAVRAYGQAFNGQRIMYGETNQPQLVETLHKMGKAKGALRRYQEGILRLEHALGMSENLDGRNNAKAQEIHRDLTQMQADKRASEEAAAAAAQRKGCCIVS